MFLASMFLPGTTPRSFFGVTWLLIACLAGVAMVFNARERKAGDRRSMGFFAFAALFIIVGILAVLMIIL